MKRSEKRYGEPRFCVVYPKLFSSTVEVIIATNIKTEIRPEKRLTYCGNADFRAPKPFSCLGSITLF